MSANNPINNYNFGVFGINQARTSIVTSTPTAVGVGTTTNINSKVFVDVSNWSQASGYGWFGGGYTTAPVSTVDRIDFSNDSSTASVRGPLSSARYNLAATGNSNYGWFGGGTTPTIVSTVDRIDFSNDSSAVSVRGPLSSFKRLGAATGNSNYGWFGGGFDGVSTRTSTINRIDFSNDSSTASVRGILSSAKALVVATGNSNYGWFGGGIDSIGTILVTVDRIDFSNDSSTASVRGPLSLARYYHAATGNSNYGWFGGGTFPITSTINRIDFSNDSSTASVRGALSSARYDLSATGNSNYGWFGTDRNLTSTVDRVDFSNDSSTASVRGPLSVAKYGSAATSGQAKSSSIRLQKAGNYGWFGGSQNVGGTLSLSLVQRIDFSNDSSTASVRGPLSLDRFESAATGNSNYGWFGGGYLVGSPGGNRTVSTVDRIDFSNDLTTSSVRSILSDNVKQLAATGNSNYGWFGGGQPLPNPKRISRIDFSNDSLTSIRGELSLIGAFPSTSQYFLAATGNSNYGWFGGGTFFPVISIVDRIDFSNDLSTTSSRGNLSQGRYGLAATGNSNYGWFGGGYSPSGLGQVSTIDRIDFSNDSSTASVRGPLSLARGSLAATGNSNYGWFGGGLNPATPATFSTVDRINFSNDLSTASVRGVLSINTEGPSATSNSTR